MALKTLIHLHLLLEPQLSKLRLLGLMGGKGFYDLLRRHVCAGPSRVTLMKLVVETLKQPRKQSSENNLQTIFVDDMNILLDLGAQVVDKVLGYYMGLT